MILSRPWRGLAALVSFVLALGCLGAPPAAHAQEASALFINLGSDDPWKVAMAPFFATQFALKQGKKPVVIFVSVQATPMLTKARAATPVPQFGGKTLGQMYREFFDAGGKVLVCPACMKALDLSERDLVPGAEVASIKSVNEVLFRTDTQVLAW